MRPVGHAPPLVAMQTTTGICLASAIPSAPNTAIAARISTASAREEGEETPAQVLGVVRAMIRAGLVSAMTSVNTMKNAAQTTRTLASGIQVRAPARAPVRAPAQIQPPTRAQAVEVLEMHKPTGME